MLTNSSSENRLLDRSERIRRVVFDLVQRRCVGDEISDDSVLTRHADLLPELADELKKVRSIHGAFEQADEAHGLDTFERIEADLRNDCVAGTDTMPERIGRYRVVRVLAEGGFGRVCVARDEQLDRDVAIKIPHWHRVIDRNDARIYLTEARIVAGLDHPAIVPVYDVGQTEDDHCYVVSKLIQGKDLAARQRESRLSEREAARIVMAVAEALHYAHQRGLVHRDIKPANILLDANDRPYVTDFGLALREEDCTEGRCYAGTPAYMSPEQARGEAHRVDGRSDIFSLGVVLYELIVGRKPFQSDSHDDLLSQIALKEPPPPRGLDESISEELERICLKALSKRAADRHATARDLAEDLRYLLRRNRQHDTSASVTSRQVTTEDVRPSEVDRKATKVVPKGLRAFDGGDADFFLDLVPGPRDRDGLPESIRRWKHRIDRTDSDETFAVGVLYGPSGCGKSSLARAGLLPRLSPRTQSIYYDATADDTETRLLGRLRKRYPSLPSDAGLAECLAAVRRGHGPADGQKLLIVIDQFEQWLHGHGDNEDRSLVQALRQCDGGRLQCLLLVRDDFWVALSRFMAELEIDLVQGHNTAMVDLFDPQHAHRVLAEFGRAYGQLPESLASLTAAQETFLKRAVAGLAEQDKVVPVRLALFAEMVKDRPWTPGTLRDIGGAAGVGVAFLEETFSSQAADPQCRLHERAARKVLAALMPGRGDDIKGRVRSNLDLLDLSGYGRKPRAFKELIRILDSETRLITPADPDTVHAEDESAPPGGRYYQLTHDYLVPSLREWLTKKQKSTRSGRAELRLAGRSMMWNARPERRQLPSAWEWLAIRTLTRPAHWTTEQRKMMRAATRRHAFMAGILALLALVFLFAGVELTALTRNLLMQVRARSASLWFALGREEAVWPLLRHSPDPTQRTRVIHGVDLVVITPEDVTAQMHCQDDLSVRRAMLLMAGELVGDPEQRASRWAELRRADPLILELVRLYQDDPDPGIHAAAEWTLRRYEQEAELARIDLPLMSTGVQNDHQWYVNSQGHTMVVVPGPAQFAMGSPNAERARAEDERLHNRRIPRSFSIASEETTVGQFQRFLRENPPVDRPEAGTFGPSLDMPHTSVTWYEAAAYCNWLSKEEGVPENQWCYVANAEGRYAAGMKVAPDYLYLRGYRLPTEAEWEYACRARATTTWYFGSMEIHLEQYAVFNVADAGQPLRVGIRKPNDFGLFDMHGNVTEWCQGLYGPYPDVREAQSAAEEAVADDRLRVLRGGSFNDPPSGVRCAARQKDPPGTRSATIGFRVARSYP